MVLQFHSAKTNKSTYNSWCNCRYQSSTCILGSLTQKCPLGVVVQFTEMAISLNGFLLCLLFRGTYLADSFLLFPWFSPVRTLCSVTFLCRDKNKKRTITVCWWRSSICV